MFDRFMWCIIPGHISSPGKQKTFNRKDAHTMAKNNLIESKKPAPFVDAPITSEKLITI
ncbi:MAG: hypothetical protein JRJ00_15055 [Deltaproteobacteria bacterium]|nr:hypothetical protein [Deltaproteobacteria bacterium]